MKYVYIMALLGAVLAGSVFLGSESKPVDAAAPARTAIQSGSSFVDGLAAQLRVGSIISPFGTGKPVTVDKEQSIQQRMGRMRSGKYETPAEYYRMDLARLTELAQKGDVNAMVQLGEQYASEVDLIQQDPKFDGREESQVIADRYFTSAIQGGYTHIASVKASKALENANPIEAQAWDFIAQYFHDPDRSALYDPAKAFSGLSSEQQKAVQSRFQEIAVSLRLQPTLPSDWDGVPGYGTPQ